MAIVCSKRLFGFKIFSRILISSKSDTDHVTFPDVETVLLYLEAGGLPGPQNDVILDPDCLRSWTPLRPAEQGEVLSQ